MLLLRLLILLLIFASRCASSQECTDYIGVDRSVPLEVKHEMERRGLSDYLLTDRSDCGGKIYWIAIPPGPRVFVPPPGFGLFVTFEKDSGVVYVDRRK